jgi:hypothetical protein
MLFITSIGTRPATGQKIWYYGNIRKNSLKTSVFAAKGRKLLAPAGAVLNAKYFHLLLKRI